MSKKILLMSDLHSGHVVGLTPPGWQIDANHSDQHMRRLAKYQREYWDFFVASLNRHKPFDVVAVVGDCIDGKGERSGGTELLTADRNEQCDMARQCIGKALSANTKLLMVYGTPYHTGASEDFEDTIAKHFGCKIGGHEYMRVDGVTFDLKHAIGGSSIPHGRHTAVAREHLWNVLWHEHSNFPKADIIVRGHVHYHGGAFGPSWTAMTLPALQGLGSKYGTKQCSGTVDFGFVVVETNQKGEYRWQAELLQVKARQSFGLAL